MSRLKILLSLVLSCTVACGTTLPVLAVDAHVTKVVISEIQTESLLDANQEFIELFNVSGETVDLTGWVLQYRAASGASWTDKAALSGLIYKDGSVVISTQGYLEETAHMHWDQEGGILASTGGNVRLLPTNLLDPEDTVGWGTGVYGETAAALKAPKGSSIQRKYVDAVPQDTGDNSKDFEVIEPSPFASIVPALDVPEDTTPPPAAEDIDNPVADPPVEDTQPNDVVPPAEVEQVPEPGDTPVDTQDPDTVAQTDDTEVDANTPPPVNETTTNETTTQGDTVVDPVPEPQDEQPTALEPLVINELMVDPSSPLLDSEDEWIELYNPNEVEFLLTGYTLQSGKTFTHKYTFTSGSIGPNAYASYSSLQTGLQLSNTAGAARVVGPDGSVVGSEVSYEDSETGNTYARNDSGVWVWTTTPTPEATNSFTVKQQLIPPVKVATKTSATKTTKVATASSAKPKSVKASATTTKKASSTTAKTTKTAKAVTPQTTEKLAYTDAPSVASHPTALAGFALLAVGYALYEYREDIANKLRLARRHLEARRAHRSGV